MWLLETIRVKEMDFFPSASGKKAVLLTPVFYFIYFFNLFLLAGG